MSEHVPLILVDNSRLRSETVCKRARFHEYHDGPTGYGIRLKRLAMPLVTGIAVHRGLAKILQWSLTNGEGRKLPPRDTTREIIGGVIYGYYKKCESQGFVGVADEYQQKTLREQVSLLEGMLWGSYRMLLPNVLREHRVIRVELEGLVIPTGCTCGLGDLVPPHAAHEARGCDATGIMSKPDVVLQRLTDSTLLNMDFKSGGDVAGFQWAEQQNQGMQFALQCAGLRMAGIQVEETLVAGLNKGWRIAAKEEDPDTGKLRVTVESARDRRQDSIFCYAWRKPANLPMILEEWRASYKFKEIGRGGKLESKTVKGAGFDRAPIWEANFAGKPKDWTVLEYWVETLPIEILEKEFRIAGPFKTPVHKLESILRTVAQNGKDWKRALWLIHQAREAAGWDNSSAEVQATLDRVVPQSWACIQYKNQCQFRGICDRNEGWEAPLGTGRFELRSPHHSVEAEQAKARGIELPAEQEEDEDE
jgi:hypothetical protein